MNIFNIIFDLFIAHNFAIMPFASSINSKKILTSCKNHIEKSKKSSYTLFDIE